MPVLNCDIAFTGRAAQGGLFRPNLAVHRSLTAGILNARPPGHKIFTSAASCLAGHGAQASHIACVLPRLHPAAPAQGREQLSVQGSITRRAIAVAGMASMTVAASVAGIGAAQATGGSEKCSDLQVKYSVDGGQSWSQGTRLTGDTAPTEFVVKLVGN